MLRFGLGGKDRRTRREVNLGKNGEESPKSDPADVCYSDYRHSPRGREMDSDKTERDRANNQRFRDIYVHASQEPWIPFFPGIDFKVLRATQETGHWTVLL